VVGHAEIDAALGRFAPLDDQALSRSWMYRGKPMHMVEHAVHVEKTLGALGFTLTEGRLIVRRLTGLVGELEGQGGEAEAREIEQRLMERQSVATA